MSARPNPTTARRTRLRGRLAGSLLAACLLGPLAPMLAAPAQAAGAPVPTPVPTTSDITMVQANIYTGLTVPRFQADVATVLAQQPDFVTYNEVPFRVDPVMAPSGYGIYRDMRNRFTAATPVAWRADRWTALDQGTFQISDWRGKPPGRVVEIGRRFANWVTLQGVDGRTLSVVSIHIAPLDKNMPDLLRRSVARLGVLVDRLAPSGPVLVGGDFNVHYTSGRYPRDLLTAHQLVPTFDTLGNYFPTGDHQGATIDFLFNRGAGQLVADSHRSVELKSDHDAVVGGFSWVGDLPTQSVTLRSDPAGTRAERLAALRMVKNDINAATAGSTVRVVSSAVDLYAVRTRLAAAAQRGANVQVTVVGRALTPGAVALKEELSAIESSWVRRCTNGCADSWRTAYRSPTLVMLGDATGAWTGRLDVSRELTSALVEESSQVTRSTGPDALSRGDELLAALR